jgi:hypothetical protein
VNSWLIKGRPSRNEFEQMLVPGAKGRWVTKRPPSSWLPGDALFLWKGAPGLQVVGVGALLHVFAPDAEGQTWFEVEYASRPFEHPIGIDELRADKVLGGASFLRAGAAGTVFTITEEQAERLAQLIVEKNDGSLDLRAHELLRPLGQRDVALPERGLVIRKEPLEQILRGEKTWEIRSKATNIRGSIALIQKGSGLIVGVCELIAVIPLGTREELAKHADKTGLDAAMVRQVIPYQRPFAWVLSNARRLPRAVPYEHPSGAVIWVKLGAGVLKRVGS